MIRPTSPARSPPRLQAAATARSLPAVGARSRWPGQLVDYRVARPGDDRDDDVEDTLGVGNDHDGEGRGDDRGPASPQVTPVHPGLRMDRLCVTNP